MGPSPLSKYATVAVAFSVIYILVKATYNFFFHPLAKFPGPKIAAVTDLWYAMHWVGGRWPFVIEETHRKYGDVVRIAPNELSFSSATSYRDIYGHASKGRHPFLKSAWYENGDEVPGIVSTRDAADHRKQRHTLAHAFSAKSLREQESVIHHYVDLFVGQIGKLGGPGTEGVNIPQALNWLTFDIIGDLAFGESFGAVATGKTNFWVSIIIDSSFWGMMNSLRKRVPVMHILLPFMVPSSLAKNRETHRQLTREKLEKRIKMADTSSRADFFDHILKKGDYSRQGLLSQSSTLITAGSETTATFLAGDVYFLLKNSKCLAKLQKEVRSAFSSLEEITGAATNELPYLNGVVEEGLRLYPPAPFGLSRISPGATVDGHYIPRGTLVSTDHWTTKHDPRYWRDAKSFRPERWIGDGFGDTTEAFQPFSLGPRACLGINLAYLESRVIIAKMAWSYEWELVSKDVDLYRDSRLQLLWKKPDIYVRFNPRAGG